MAFDRFTGRLRSLFAAQFEEDEIGIAFRKNSSGAAVRVSASERDAFEARFARRFRWIFWGYIAAVLVLVGIVVATDAPPESNEQAFYIGMAGLLISFSGLVWWAWTEPARVLSNRTPMGRPRSRAERDRIHLERLSYFQLALVPVIVTVALVKVAQRWDILHGWGRLWLVGAVCMTILAVVQAFRKWRYARN